ncbi:GtrA family protein [Anabaena subtropica]
MRNRIIRFLICGIITAAFNVLLLITLLELLKIEQPLHRNIVNIVSIEISLLFSFFIYRIWVWSEGKWNFRNICFRQIPMYHISYGLVIVVRSFLLFPILDWLGINYIINTLIGILVGSIINYIFSEKLVF